MPVEPIKARRLYQEVADQLSRLITTGEFKPGQRLPSERELAAGLKVSRPTIREAMIALELARVIEIRTGSGVYVLDTSVMVPSEDAGPGPFELIEARILIEGEAAALAAQRISEVEVSALEQTVREMEKRVAQQLPAEEADMRFHQIVARATRNSAMIAAVDQLWDFRARLPMWRKLHEVIREIENRPDWTDDGNATRDHRQIVDALRSKNAEVARQTMQQHLQRVRDVLMTASELDVIRVDPAPQSLTKKE